MFAFIRFNFNGTLFKKVYVTFIDYIMTSNKIPVQPPYFLNFISPAEPSVIDLP